MLSFHLAALLSVLAVGTFAAPGGRDEICMTDSEAQFVATKYGELISNYSNAAADAILTPDFVDYGEGVNTLINSCPQGSAAISLPLLQATFSSREEFEIGQGQQALINFEQLQIWNTCRASIIRWKTTNTANITDVRPIIGLIVMEVVRAPAGGELPWLIKTVYTEFDSGAWLQNLQEAGVCGVHDTGLPNQPAPGCIPAMPGSPASGNMQPPMESAASAQQNGNDDSPQPGIDAPASGVPGQSQPQPPADGYGGDNSGPIPVVYAPPPAPVGPMVHAWSKPSMPYNTSASASRPWSSGLTSTKCEESSWTTYVVPTPTLWSSSNAWHSFPTPVVPTPAMVPSSTTYWGAYSGGRW